MRFLWFSILFPFLTFPQIPQPLWVTHIYDITSANQVQDMRSNTRQCNMFSFSVTSGTGNWAVQLEYSDSKNGPWTVFPGSAGVSYTNPSAVGVGYGYHPYVRLNTTAGTTAINLSCEKDFYFPTGTGITQLQGDATAGPGNGTQTITLNTVNSNPGTFGGSSTVPVLTVNGKGLVTGVSTATIPPSGITQLTGDVSTASGSGSQAATLATVNTSPGTFGSSTEAPVITVNGKGLVTAVTTAPVAAGTKSYTQSFTNATSVSIAYDLGTENIYPQVVDASGQTIGYDSFTVTDDNDATLTFSTPQSGSVTIIAATSGAYRQTFANATSVTVTHGLGTTSPLATVFDASNNVIGYTSLTPTDANTETLAFATPQSGSIVLLKP